MLLEQVERVTAEVLENLQLEEKKTPSVRRYVRRAMQRILTFCNREDFPAALEDTAAQIAEDMLKADMVAESEKDVSSIKRGDTTISYQADAARQATVDFVKNYEQTLIHYRKMNLPKDLKNARS